MLLSAPSLCLAVTLARFQLAATLASPRFASTFCRSIRRPPRKETSTTPSSSLSAAKVSALAELHRNHTPRGWKSIGWRPNCSSTNACSYTPILPVPARHYTDIVPTLCCNPRTVVRHYFFGWFPLDLFSILPSIFDIIPLVQASNAADESVDAVTAEKLSGFRAVRALRLVKLVRLIRASRLLARWQARVGLSHSSLTLLRIIVTLVLATHWCKRATHSHCH